MTPEGFLRVDGVVARTGIYEYPDSRFPGGVRRELRKPEHVLSQYVIDGFEGKPVTNLHPGPAIEVTPENIHRYEVGSVSVARRDGETLVAPMLIKNKGAIKAVLNGRQQLSPGYMSDVNFVAGEAPEYGYPGNERGRYDGVQMNIDINHLALVDIARGGEGMRMRMDAADVDAAAWDKVRRELKLDGEETNPKPFEKTSTGSRQEYGGQGNPSGEMNMADQRNDGEMIRSLESQLAASQASVKSLTEDHAKEKLRADTAEGALTEVKKQIPILQAEVQQAQSAAETAMVQKEKLRADGAESKLTALSTSFDKMVRARAALESTARITLGSEIHLDGLDDKAVMVATLKRLDPQADVGDHTEIGVVTGRFQAACERRDGNARSLAQVSTIMDAQKLAAAQTKQKEAAGPAWKKPLPNAIKR